MQAKERKGKREMNKGQKVQMEGMRQAKDYPEFKDQCPAEAIVVDPGNQISGWIEPEDYRLISKDEYNDCTIEVEFTEEMTELYRAWRHHKTLIWDEDPDSELTSDDGRIDAQIFWGITYRGGLSIA